MRPSEPRAADAALGARLRTLRPTRAVVDLDAVAANFAYLRERAGRADVLCIVKADAYGHGAVAVSRRLEAEGARWFGVAVLEEGLELRDAGVCGRVLLLGGVSADQVDLALARDLTPAVVSLSGWDVLAEAAARRRSPVACHVKVDTGMTRLGVPWQDFGAVVRRAREGRAHGPRIEGLFTHLACSDDPAVPFTGVQLERFRRCRDDLDAAGLPRPLVHVASSAGLLTRAAADVDLARPGASLYGLNPFGNVRAPELTPALALASRVVRVVTVPAGTAVGYGASFITLRESRLATVPAGYDDGVSRELGDRWEVAVRGRLAPLVGRVSMDLVVADVTGLPEVAEGDEVVIVGGAGTGAHSIEEMAQRLRTIPYEIPCRIGPRVPRVHVAGGRVVGIASRFERLPSLARGEAAE